MISAKNLIKMARKWQRMASPSRRRICLSKSNKEVDFETSCNTTSVVNKGHFVVYTADERRFVMPLVYLKHNILLELFKMSEEEFGVSTNGPIRFPCDAVFMEYVVTLISRGVAKDLEKALINSIERTGRCSLSAFSFHWGLVGQQIPLSGY
ncbi:hypothetical protein L484_014353 [Morus notabilis]|uniref:Auxin-induced protein 6B n=1 Tax=Morus notabilis TaxID=981085 RepID=W9S9V3_9ROSA|nr:auxin-responsive protein SAUR68 [Morus notabilis]EXB95380.1 hypothetical protein L484_014353 [Morus notabilis]